jgi:hypothetical protein
LADRGLFDRAALSSLAAGAAGQSSRELKLFTVASLELWLRANVDEVRDSPPGSLEELLEPGEVDAAQVA